MNNHLKIIYILLYLTMIATAVVGVVVLATFSKWFLLLLVPVWLCIGTISGNLRSWL